MKCPVCGKYKFEEENDFDICPYCMWENDGLQYDPTMQAEQIK